MLMPRAGRRCAVVGRLLAAGRSREAGAGRRSEGRVRASATPFPGPARTAPSAPSPLVPLISCPLQVKGKTIGALAVLLSPEMTLPPQAAVTTLQRGAESFEACMRKSMTSAKPSAGTSSQATHLPPLHRSFRPDPFCRLPRRPPRLCLPRPSAKRRPVRATIRTRPRRCLRRTRCGFCICSPPSRRTTTSRQPPRPSPPSWRRSSTATA